MVQAVFSNWALINMQVSVLPEVFDGVSEFCDLITSCCNLKLLGMAI